jgi:putative peptidoglycan lipid II flippase
MILNFVFLSAMLYFKVEGYPLRHLGFCMAKICLAAGIMGLSIYFLSSRLDPLLTIGIGSRFFALLILMTAGLIVYSLVIYILQVPEFQELLVHVQKFRKRI